MNKISICTVCMNRLVHLKETLPANIEDNSDHPSLEFIVLDYNSGDGMENWARSQWASFIGSGLLKYYKTEEPAFMDLSHAKNMALRLATGDVLCMVDADNFTGNGYASWVNSVFTQQGNNSIVTTIEKDKVPYRDVGGKIGVSRKALYRSKGFDESLTGYGIEDIDLINRLEKEGGKRVFITDPQFLQFIPHSNEERLKNHYLINNLESLYVEVTTSLNIRNRVLYLLKDKTCLEASFEYEEALKNDTIASHGGWVIRKGNNHRGNYTISGNAITASLGSLGTMQFKLVGEEVLHSSENSQQKIWKKLSGYTPLYQRLVMGYSECINRIAYFDNDQDHSGINKEGWGKGTVYLNFDRNNPISISASASLQ